VRTPALLYKLITFTPPDRFDAGVQQFGCWALSNLALSGEEIMRKMKKKGAVEVRSWWLRKYACTRVLTVVMCVY
jgi:hypothetical protein